MKNKCILIAFLILFSFNSKAQILTQDSKLSILSIDKEGKPFDAHTNLCFMYLNITNGDFILKADANTFKTSDQHIDSTLISNGSQPIVFNGNINDDLFQFIHDDNDGKIYNMKGVLSINGVDILCVAQFKPVTFGDKNDTKNYRLHFRLSVDAKKITIYGLENKLTKQVLFEIGRGSLNITN